MTSAFAPERTRGFFDDSLRGLSGIEVLRSLHEGRSPQPPIHYWCGRRLVDLKHGEATIAMPASGWFCGPKGRLHTGMFGFLLDMTHFYAVFSTLPAGAACTTAELSMTNLGEPPASGGELLSRTRVIYADKHNALVEGFVSDDLGRPLAQSTSRYFLFASSSTSGSIASSAPDLFGALPVLGLDAPVPVIAPVTSSHLQRMSGLEILQAELRGEISSPPIDLLTGIRLIEVGDGRAIFTMPVGQHLMQELGTVFGGVIALLAKCATGAAVQTIAPAGTAFTALDLKLNFLRPIDLEGDELTATGSVTHRGRRLSIANAEITHRGRRVAIATGTTGLTPP